MSKFSFTNPFGRKVSNTIESTIVAELLEGTSPSSVATPPAPDTPTTVRSSTQKWDGQTYVCEVCPSDTAKSHGSPKTLAKHVQENHPSEWPYQLIIPKSKNHAKKWKAGQVKTVVDTYLQVRATQNVGRHFIVNRAINATVAYWIDSSIQSETSNLAHIKALNAASMAVGRNTKSSRDVLNATLAVTKGVVKHQPILVRQPGGKGPQCALTEYGLKRIKQIRDRCGYTGSGGIEELTNLLSVVNTPPQSKVSTHEPVVGDPAVMKPRNGNEDKELLTEVNPHSWNDAPSNIVSTWAGLTEGVLKYVADLQQQVSDFKNMDALVEAKNKTISQKDEIIASQKQRIVELNNVYSNPKELEDLKIQVQNLTEERDTLLTANEKLVNQAKAHKEEKQELAVAKKTDVQAFEARMEAMAKDLAAMKQNLE